MILGMSILGWVFLGLIILGMLVIEYLLTFDDAQTWEKRRKYYRKYHEWPWW